MRNPNSKRVLDELHGAVVWRVGNQDVAAGRAFGHFEEVENSGIGAAAADDIARMHREPEFFAHGDHEVALAAGRLTHVRHARKQRLMFE